MAVTETMPGAERSQTLPVTDFRVDRRLPVGEQVYRALRAEIVALNFTPGTSISESALCRRFGVSRTPVRAAIQLLVEEGLIDVFPNQGSFVAPIRLKDIKDAHFVRVSVECAVLRDLAPSWTRRTSEESRASLTLQRDLVALEDADGFHAEDERFHNLFSTVAGRTGVWPTIVGAKTRLARFIRLSGDPGRLSTVVEEHEAVIDALDAGDIERAVEAMRYHLDRIFVLFDPLPERHRAYFAD